MKASFDLDDPIQADRFRILLVLILQSQAFPRTNLDLQLLGQFYLARIRTSEHQAERRKRS